MASKFHDLLRKQITNEFGAMQQYVAIAVWADAADLPQIASHFYAHSRGERNHAMMMVQYLLDRGEQIDFDQVEAPRSDFESPADAYRAAQAHEVKVTGQIETLFHAAREENDPLGEQFMLWFLREQVEEVANMDTMVTISDRAGDNWFEIETYLNRESGSGASNTGTPPATAGGAI
ncbi:ferritin [Dietzia sp.]|uniref:ferritin n=1 Tax=Dietzia sp. TaxID=1871616 RepID=UPI002FD92102